MKAIDALEIRILVDNVSDGLSSTPSFVETETAGLARHGMKLLSGKPLCCAAHDLSYLITAKAGSTNHTLLFDSGRRTGCSSTTRSGSASISARSRRWCCRTAIEITAAPFRASSRR